MSKKLHNSDPIRDRSDVKSMLETIESMYNACQDVLNIYSQTSLMLAITIEAKMLLMKLEVMKQRWHYHLPFKEACTVDFYDWGKKIEKMSHSIVGPGETGEADERLSEYCPSKHFLLDLFTLLPENAGNSEVPAYYCELDITKLVASQERMQKLITKKWSEYREKFSDLVAEKVNHRTGGVVQPLSDRSYNIQMTCNEVLQQLSAILYELYNMPVGVIQRDQFARLAERVVNEAGYGGRKAQISARHDVDDLKNTTPEEDWEKRRKEEIQVSIDIINEMKYGRQVFNFLGRNYDINGRYAGLGKYLNSIRRSISVDELSMLIEQLYRISYFLEDVQQTEIGSVGNTDLDHQSSSVRSHGEKPADITLPLFFNHDLRVNKAASAELVKKTYAIGLYLGRNLSKQEKEGPARPYLKWKWNHLLQAFKEMRLIEDKTTQSEFSQFLEQVLPGRKAANILQSIYRNFDKLSDSIVADVKDEFSSVLQLMKPTT